MITKVKFGECLQLLLSSLDMSNNRLSKGINVDSSLISRWLHEQRIPSYHGNYIESITNFLSENILNSIQEERLNDVLNIVCGHAYVKIPIKGKLMKALLESQGRSLEGKRIRTNKKIDLSNKDNNNIIIGRKNVLASILTLIETAGKEKCKNNNVIYLSSDNNLDLIKIQEDFIGWKEAILKALINGWTVKFLFKLNQNTKEIMNLILLAIPLLETGRFLLYYYKTYDVASQGREVAIIPGKGALSCFSTSLNSEIDCAFYTNNQVGIDILCKNFNIILLPLSKSLMEYYDLDESLAYNNSLDESDNTSGNQFLFKNNLSLSLIPNVLLKKLLEKLSFTNDQLIKILELHQRRVNSFLLNIKQHEYLDIYLLSSMQNIIKNKELSFYSFNVVNTINFDIEDIIILIQNILNLLKTYDNYKFSFVNETLYKNKGNTVSSFIIKERHSVHIESSKHAIVIQEPMVVNAFEGYFKEIWEQISPIDKDKKEVIKWLQHQVDTFKKQLIKK
ncbi:hypothetical protein LL037_24200 [Clostridium estertheticum]|uniref:Uncharacterized protein n=1 Tax=Clostridium estertheticum TaxID=238834 RepID=A0AA47EJZ8_9CLOT|nr:hypothetical protein [Clostridium estertheticum]MBU3155365.1 hypothetical protein [Clostridium estertheticum]MBU3197694.1 hypothetical protein [Clostridium estertheticum]WAG60426.1 hypothetical protein LL038_23355 [Clostridium estertheticum]WAG65498.1 hypothetical protein LL037_24200 [Clostridium estertheticum]